MKAPRSLSSDALRSVLDAYLERPNPVTLSALSAVVMTMAAPRTTARVDLTPLEQTAFAYVWRESKNEVICKRLSDLLALSVRGVVVRISIKVAKTSGIPVQDLTNEGICRLLQKLPAFDPARGSLASFTATVTRGYLAEWALTQTSTTHVTSTAIRRMGKARKAGGDLAEELVNVGASLHEVSVLTAGPVESMSVEIGEPPVEFETGEESIEDRMIREQLMERLGPALGELDLQELRVVALEFGMLTDTEQPMTVPEVARKMRLPESKVHELRARALFKLRGALEPESED